MPYRLRMFKRNNFFDKLKQNFMLLREQKSFRILRFLQALLEEQSLWFDRRKKSYVFVA